MTSDGAAPAWLEEVYRLVEQKWTDHAIDLVLQEFSSLLETDQFEICDAVLDAVDTSRLNIAVMLSVLTITRHAEDSLANFDLFFGRVEREIRKTEPERRADRLLMGMRHRPRL